MQAISIKVVITVAVFLSVLGLADATLRICYSPDFAFGIKTVLNDPGKDFFHIVILPALAFLILCVPYTSTNLWNGPLRAWWGRSLLVLFIVVTAYFTASGSMSAFFSTNATPEDFSSLEFRKKYYQERVKLWDLVLESNGEKQLSGTEARDKAYAYAAKLVEGQSGWGDFVREASPRRHLATLLTFLGNFTAVWLFFAVCFSQMPGQKLSNLERDSLLLMIALFSLWLPLKIYSEWYFQFHAEQVSYSLFGVAAIALIAATLIVFFKGTDRLFATVAPAAVTTIVAVMTLVFQQQSEWFAPIASLYREFSIPEAILVNVIIVTTIIVISLDAYRKIECQLASQ